MQAKEPSRTAFAAAFHRAAHQVLEQGRIFSDPLALRILGIEAGTINPEEVRRPFAMLRACSEWSKWGRFETAALRRCLLLSAFRLLPFPHPSRPA